MEGENIYDRIQEILGESPGSFSILEEKIDIDLQMEYFEQSRSHRKNLDEEAVLRDMNEIYNPDCNVEQKKELLACLASIEKVEAYRFIENYLRQDHAEIRNWAILALQESRMLLESKLLEENQVFISTGLGGKGSKLRYFLVLIRKDKGRFSELQKKIIRNEFEIALNDHDSEIEKIDYMGHFATLGVIVPLKVPLKDIFRGAIWECNQYGDFLRSNFIVTNVRELDMDEIEDFLRKQEQANQGEDI